MYAPKNQPARGRYENSLIHSVKLFKASLSFFFFFWHTNFYAQEIF